MSSKEGGKRRRQLLLSSLRVVKRRRQQQLSSLRGPLLYLEVLLPNPGLSGVYLRSTPCLVIPATLIRLPEKSVQVRIAGPDKSEGHEGPREPHERYLSTKWQQTTCVVCVVTILVSSMEAVSACHSAQQHFSTVMLLHCPALLRKNRLLT